MYVEINAQLFDVSFQIEKIEDWNSDTDEIEEYDVVRWIFSLGDRGDRISGLRIPLFSETEEGFYVYDVDYPDANHLNQANILRELGFRIKNV